MDHFRLQYIQALSADVESQDEDEEMEEESQESQDLEESQIMEEAEEESEFVTEILEFDAGTSKLLQGHILGRKP